MPAAAPSHVPPPALSHQLTPSAGGAPRPQVAETFALAAGEGGPPLGEVATLDTCVTVVDAANLMANL